MHRLFPIFIFLGTFATTAVAAPSTLIRLKGGKPRAALAKSWTKIKDGQYEFQLDTSKKLRDGSKVHPDAVKQALEAKLDVTVSAKGNAAVIISYKGDEKRFLKSVAKTKIRGKKSVALALESSGSDGGIRAKSVDRPPKEGEVKAIAIGIGSGVTRAKVNVSKSHAIPSGVVKVRTDSFKVTKGQIFFFVPDKKTGGVWKVVSGSLTLD